MAVDLTKTNLAHIWTAAVIIYSCAWGILFVISVWGFIQSLKRLRDERKKTFIDVTSTPKFWYTVILAVSALACSTRIVYMQDCRSWNGFFSKDAAVVLYQIGLALMLTEWFIVLLILRHVNNIFANNPKLKTNANYRFDKWAGLVIFVTSTYIVLFIVFLCTGGSQSTARLAFLSGGYCFCLVFFGTITIAKICWHKPETVRTRSRSSSDRERNVGHVMKTVILVIPLVMLMLALSIWRGRTKSGANPSPKQFFWYLVFKYGVELVVCAVALFLIKRNLSTNTQRLVTTRRAVVPAEPRE
eukprot:c8155_g1_i1.p1 GENE.c8155_g1_i1~~c8155_g1_i1.p1  ORF type:complete len:310 (-),score=35.99 c8155_g1_i1:549-1451(-)